MILSSYILPSGVQAGPNCSQQPAEQGRATSRVGLHMLLCLITTFIDVVGIGVRELINKLCWHACHLSTLTGKKQEMDGLMLDCRNSVTNNMSARRVLWVEKKVKIAPAQ